MKWSDFNAGEKKRWRQRAKRFLHKNQIVTGYNGLYGSDREKELVENLARQFAFIWNLPQYE